MTSFVRSVLNSSNVIKTMIRSPKKELSRILTCCCVISVAVIIIPMFLLDKFWYSHPVEAAAGNFIFLSDIKLLIFFCVAGLKGNLRDSTLLEKAHILYVKLIPFCNCNKLSEHVCVIQVPGICHSIIDRPTFRLFLSGRCSPIRT